MRLNVLSALVVLAALFCPEAMAPASLAAEFPFDGYIAAPQAEIASGPGRRFYTTGKLPRGTKVEVYREDDAGWLAIRPPEGSFSWIPAEHVEQLDDDMGKVRSATESWIGTSIEDVKQHKSQVSLKAGEVVQIIDRKKVATEDGEEAWLKIAPPAGEFRYVHSRDVSREPVEVETANPNMLIPALAQVEADAPIPAVSPGAGEPEEPRPFRAATGAIALRDIDEVRSRLASMREDLAGLAQTSAARNALDGVPQNGHGVKQAQFQATAATDRTLSPDGFVPRKRRASEQLGPVPVPSDRLAQADTPTFTHPHRDSIPRGSSLSPAANRAEVNLAAQPISTQPLQNQPTTGHSNNLQQGSATNQLQQLELDLSLMVAQEKSTWNLAALRSQAEQLVERSPTATERGQARLLLDKIKRFEDAFAVADQGPLGSAAATGSEPSSGSPYAPRYDAKGWLKPVVSRTKPAAPYAVVDEDGKPLCFVTPSPGLNLARYANKQVGLFGKRGYIEALKTPHVVAERVIDLDRHAEQVSSLR